jgi:hypothetical protein
LPLETERALLLTWTASVVFLHSFVSFAISAAVIAGRKNSSDGEKLPLKVTGVLVRTIPHAGYNRRTGRTCCRRSGERAIVK